MEPVALGKYTLLHRLARGGMAELYLARAAGVAGFERLVAVKVVSGRYAEDPSFAAMFEDEVRIVATLSHPNIGQVLDVGHVEGTHYLVMEHIHGQDLRAILRRCMERDGAMPPSIVAQIGAKICSALQHAHEARSIDGKALHIIHRDVSLSNIMVSYEGQVKLIDFGIAKATGRLALTVPGTVKGKLRYLSPEQALGQDIDQRSDLFTLGTSLWEASVGQHLFEAPTEVQIYEAIAKGDIRRPSSIVAGYPMDFERILLKALAHRREDRYLVAREMQLDLEAYARKAGSSLSDIELGHFMQETFRREADSWTGARARGIGLVEWFQSLASTDETGAQATFLVEASPRQDSLPAAEPSRGRAATDGPRKTLFYGEARLSALPGPRAMPLARPPSVHQISDARQVAVTKDGRAEMRPREPEIAPGDAVGGDLEATAAPLPPTARAQARAGLYAEPTVPDDVLLPAHEATEPPTISDAGVGPGIPALFDAAGKGRLAASFGAPQRLGARESGGGGSSPQPVFVSVAPPRDTALDPIIGQSPADLEERQRQRKEAAPGIERVPTGDWAHQARGERRAGTHPYFKEHDPPPGVPAWPEGRIPRNRLALLLAGAAILFLAALGLWLALRGRPAAPSPERRPAKALHDGGQPSPSLPRVELTSEPPGATVYDGPSGADPQSRSASPAKPSRGRPASAVRHRGHEPRKKKTGRGGAPAPEIIDPFAK